VARPRRIPTGFLAPSLLGAALYLAGRSRAGMVGSMNRADVGVVEPMI
jgi:hypothetical protein